MNHHDLVMVLLVLLSLDSGVDGLRGKQRRRQQQQQQQQQLHRQQQSSTTTTTTTTNKKNQRQLQLVEESPCIPFVALSADVKLHDNSDDVCRHRNYCPNGCCRSYQWLMCDESNAFPDLPCVCNENTKEQNTAQRVWNATMTTATTNITNATTNNNDVSDTQTMIAADACAQGSKYHSWLSFAQYTKCFSAQDCHGVLDAADNAKNRVDAEFVILAAQEDLGATVATQPLCCLADICFCGKVNPEDWTTQCVRNTTPEITTQLHDMEHTVLGGNMEFLHDKYTEEPTMLETPFAWTMTPTARPSTAGRAETPTRAPIAIPEKIVNDNVVNVLASSMELLSKTIAPGADSTMDETMGETINYPTTVPATTTKAPMTTTYAPLISATAPSPAPHKTACSEGSWYHNNPTFDYLRKCFSNNDCPDTEQERDECCLKSFCFCGKYNGDRSACAN